MPGAADPRLRVVFMARPDLRTLPGGDTVQIHHTMRGLAGLGIDVTLASPRDAGPALPGACDVLHCFNLLLSHQYEAAMREARARGIPCVLSPIYWDTTDFDRDAAGHAWWKRAALRLLQSLPAVHPRRLLRSRLKSVAHNASYADALHRTVAGVDMLLPNSTAEDELLRRQFPHATPSRVVCNAVALPRQAPLPPEDLPARFILCAGRIERRKNQHQLIRAIGALRAAGGPRLPLLLLGSINAGEAGYWRRCLAEARRHGVDVEHRPAVAWEQVFAYYRAAALHAQPSWFETPGLSSLEAAAVGCPVVCTDVGSAAEYFGPYAEYCRPGDVASIRDALRRALDERDGAARERRARFIADAYSWEAAAAATAEAYAACLAKARESAA